MQDPVLVYIQRMRAAGFTNSTPVYVASGLFVAKPQKGEKGPATGAVAVTCMLPMMAPQGVGCCVLTLMPGLVLPLHCTHVTAISPHPHQPPHRHLSGT